MPWLWADFRPAALIAQSGLVARRCETPAKAEIQLNTATASLGSPTSGSYSPSRGPRTNGIPGETNMLADYDTAASATKG